MAFAKPSPVVLLALLALTAGTALAGSRSLLETDAVDEVVILGGDSMPQEITREFSSMVDIICSYPDGVAANTIQDAMLHNMTDNSDFVTKLSVEQMSYPWAAPVLDDMEWLCKMMKEFSLEREDAEAHGKVCAARGRGGAKIGRLRGRRWTTLL